MKTHTDRDRFNKNKWLKKNPERNRCHRLRNYYKNRVLLLQSLLQNPEKNGEILTETPGLLQKLQKSLTKIREKQANLLHKRCKPITVSADTPAETPESTIPAESYQVVENTESDGERYLRLEGERLESGIASALARGDSAHANMYRNAKRRLLTQKLS